MNEVKLYKGDCLIKLRKNMDISFFLLGIVFVHLFWIFKHIDNDYEHDLWKIQAYSCLLCGIMLILGSVLELVVLLS